MDIEGKKVEETTPTNEAGSDEQPSETESEKPKAEKGTLEVVFTDSSGEVISYYPSVVRYQVVDDQGRVVEGFLQWWDLPRLAFWYLYSQDHPI